MYLLIKEGCVQVDVIEKEYPELLKYCKENFIKKQPCIFYKRVYILINRKVCSYMIVRRSKRKHGRS